MKPLQLTALIFSVFSAGLYCGNQISLDSKNDAPPREASSNNHTSSPSNSHEKLADESRDNTETGLFQAENKTSELELQDIALAKQIEQNNLPIPENMTVHELMDRVDLLPSSLINQQLENTLGFDKNYIENIEDPNDFAKQLIEIALSDEALTEDDLMSELDARVIIDFSLSPVAGLRQFNSLSTLAQYNRIFVHFISQATFPSLIVRWQHYDTGEILILTPQQLRDNQNRYLSFIPENGWKAGTYQVSVFDLNSNHRLVGTSTYHIDRVIEDDKQNHRPNQDVIDDLVSTGRATLKR
ncbi:MAG: hypothetical protein P8179_24805 [Candidatus Thiodiazotropha sp.]|jgi:hypothetical protein